jgi:predicted acyl esterase
METSINKKEGSKPIYKIRVEKDIFIPMRDGVRLAADIYYPDDKGKFPALLAYGPYGKELQALVLTFPPQARPSPLWDGGIEAGDTNYIVPRGYAHIIVDARGTGKSEGECCGVYGAGGGYEGRDCYDLVDWIARQPWCDGNVGMVGISYFASVQILAAAEKPPHLKAIFANGGHYDAYELAYHGGIMWLMPRASREGRGGDSGYALGNAYSAMKKRLSREEFERRVQERLNDPDVRNYPNFYHILHYPDSHPLFIDLLLNPSDGPFYRGGQPINQCEKVTIPTHLSVKWGRGWTVDGTIDCYLGVKGPKKLELQPLPPMQERPFHEFHDLMIRWYDYWLKGIDTGIMDEPPIKIFVEGIKQWRYEQEWPLKRTNWTKFYLRPRGRLFMEPEPLDTESVPPDGFYQAPLTVTSVVQSLKWASQPMVEEMEVTGPAVLYLYASIDTDDTNFIVKLYDIDPHGNRSQLTTGWLKASHRELDKNKSTPWRPHHPHTRSIPVVPGEVFEYAIRVYSFSNVFRVSHRMELELSSQESLTDATTALLPPDSFHLPSGRATTHKIYRDRNHPSYLLLPMIPTR